MRDHSHHIEVDRATAIRTLLDNCRFQPESETVPVSGSFGRVLAEDVFAQLDMPNCLTCMMDSVAVRWSEFENGMPDTSEWVKGRDWEFANTGVGMPEGFDTAVTVEHVIFSENDTKIRFDAMPSKKFAGTRARGSRMKKGDLLAAKGTVVTPRIAAHIMGGNILTVEVVRKPRVAFIPTGNELTAANGRMQPEAADGTDSGPIPRGMNIETNSVMMDGKIRQWGGEPVLFAIIRDEPDAIEKALREAASVSDIIVLNAGTSKGSDDWSIEVVEKIGKVFYHQITHGPGHHSWFAVIGGIPVIGISGPPSGASFTADFYVRPAIMKYLGLPELTPGLKVRLGSDLPPKKFRPKTDKPAGETTPVKGGVFFSVRMLRLALADDGVLEAFPLPDTHWSDASQSESAAAYYLLRTAEGLDTPKKGDWIEVDLRPDYLP